MTIDCSHLDGIGHSLNLIRSCYTMHNGALRLETPFVYPNGSYIDIFLKEKHALLGSYVLSDFGQTSLFLRDAQVNVISTQKKKQALDDICVELDVKYREGAFEVEIDKPEMSDISDALTRISQACIRLADFLIHQRLRSANAFRDDIEEFLEAAGLRYVADIEVPGPYERAVKLDFEVFGATGSSYVLILAALNETAAHSSANEIFRKLHDLTLKRYHEKHKFVIVYNSDSAAIRSDDLKRLGEQSEVVSYPDEEKALGEILRSGPSPVSVS